MISITPFAAQKTKDFLKEKNLSDKHYLRVGLKGGGCSGFIFDLKFDDKELEPDDCVYIDRGVKIVTKEICVVYIDGTEIDYVDKLVGGGFKFNNPNATKYCGCGKSFNV